MFSKQLKHAITQVDKKPTVIAKETGFNDMFISRHTKNENEPDIIVFLRNFILKYNLTPDYLYELITETTPEVSNEHIKRIKDLEKQNEKHQKVIRELSSVLIYLIEQCKKSGIVIDLCNKNISDI